MNILIDVRGIWSKQGILISNAYSRSKIFPLACRSLDPVPASAGSEPAFPCPTVSFVRSRMQERLSAYASVIIAPPLLVPTSMSGEDASAAEACQSIVMTNTFVRRHRQLYEKLRLRPCYNGILRPREGATQNESVEILPSALCFHKLNWLELRFLFTWYAALALDRQSTITTSTITRYRCKPLVPGTCVTKAAFLEAVLASVELSIG